MILVNHHLADLLVIASLEMVMLFALVCHLTLEVHLVVVQNALSALIAHLIKHARTKNVSILVLVHVESMRDAM
jgi:hypothetical protein